jgi:hypothetical protein
VYTVGFVCAVTWGRAERSTNLNGKLTRTGEWTGLTWSLRKRSPGRWPHPELLRAGAAAHDEALVGGRPAGVDVDAAGQAQPCAAAAEVG